MKLNLVSSFLLWCYGIFSSEVFKTKSRTIRNSVLILDGTCTVLVAHIMLLTCHLLQSVPVPKCESSEFLHKVTLLM